MSMMRALFRTERVMELGGLNGRNRMGMDSDFTKRFQRLFPTGSVQGQPLYFYSPRPDSLTVAKATALGSPARQKLVRRDLRDRCVSRLLWMVGAARAFRQRQIQDFWYPADLEVEAAYHPQPEAVAH